jgi:isoleucyl-tRNA synthetase
MFSVREANEAKVVEAYSDLIMSELNVKQVGTLKDAGDVVNYALNPLPSFLGKKFGKDFPKVQKALREGKQADVRKWAEALTNGEAITLQLDGESFEVTPEECEVLQGAAEGFTVAEEKGYVAAVDVKLTDDLVKEGLAREVVRRIQSMRRDADFKIDDNITIVYTASDQLENAIQQFADYIKAETLAVTLDKGEPSNGYHKEEFLPNDDAKKDSSIKGETLKVGVKQVEK